MGVPELDVSMGPLKKRQRLSLKANKQKSVKTEKTPATDISNNASQSASEQKTLKSESSTTASSLSSSESGTSTSTDTTSSSTSSSSCTTSSSGVSDSRVPPVASLENLGNTCFMNSVMQVLRYTPGFLQNLALLYQDIQASEKIKRKNKSNDEELPSFSDDLNKRCCKVVKNVYKVYRDLSTLEEKYEEVASEDVMSMAVKPNKVLQAVRELNPMYEGHMQHDAQEFLRCILCYFQDAEKEVQKFYNQLPHKFSPKINPIMQRFLSCPNTSQETKDKVVKIVNEISDIKADTELKESFSAAEKVKANLFPKSEVKTETANSPKKAQQTPKLGDTAVIVDKINKNTVHVGASTEPCITVKPESDNLINENKLEAKPGTTDEKVDSDKDVGDDTFNKQEIRSSQRRGRRYKPYDADANKTAKAKGLDGRAVKGSGRGRGRKAISKEDNQPSMMEGFTKTYSSKKRLGMRGTRVTKSAEELFDAVKELDSIKDLEVNMETIEDKPTKPESRSPVTGSKCNGSTSDSSSINLLKSSPVGAVSENKTSKETVSMSKSSVDSDKEAVKSETSYQDVFAAFLSAIPDDDSDSVEQQSDSDHEDIVMKKKRQKELRNTPRKSPRKLASEILRTTPRKLQVSKLALTSKSESSVEDVKRNLELSNSVQSGIKSETCDRNENSNITQSNSKTGNSVTIKTENKEDTLSNSPIVDCKPNKLELKSDSPVPDVLAPVVKLENCDYVLNENGTFVSAAYATKCLTPQKNCRNSSNNYLKQRNQLLPMELTNEADFRNALAEMLNSPVKSRSKYDLIERTFQGTMMLRTRCLQCESSKERQEEFHDISVPVRIEKSDSDTEDEDDGSQCGMLDLIEASTEVEKLHEENKYFCENCKTYVEAERSVHYDVMPDILTLHLKRFSSETGKPGNIIKINDHVDIPLNIPCLRYRCSQPCLRPDHRYRLYAIVTHSGYTLTSGHYLSYVRALPSSTADSAIDQSNTLLKDTVENKTVDQSTERTVNSPDKQMPATRRKMGVATKLPSRFNDNVITNTKVKAFNALAPKKMKSDLVSPLLPSNRFECEWFECDDETVRVFEESEFKELLTESRGALLGTPYLLFYHKATLF